MEIDTFAKECAELVGQVHEHRIEVLVTKSGVPCARIVPVAGRERSAFGFLRGTVLSHGDIVAPDPAAFRKSD